MKHKQDNYYSFPDKLYKVVRGYSSRTLCFGGKGLFSRLFFINNDVLPESTYFYEIDSKSDYRYWDVYTLIPSSDIGKYSSFKVYSKDKINQEQEQKPLKRPRIKLQLLK